MPEKANGQGPSTNEPGQDQAPAEGTPLPELPGFRHLARALAEEAARPAPETGLAPGARVGNIRIEGLLGEGGMGTVWRGFDERLGRPVAIKSLRGLALSPGSRTRLRREARLLARLDHPRICRIYELLETEEGDFLVLELVRGTSLARLLKEQSPEVLEKDRPLAIAEGVADALAAAHARRIVHRDLKPDNVIVSPEGDVKVLDFGISRSVEEPEAVTDGLRTPTDLRLTVTGRLLGTPRYMSPEQAQGEPVTEASDLFSFGLLLQELLTGAPAMDAETPEELLEKTVAGEREALPGTVAGDLRELLDRLLERVPSRRPTAEETLERLRWIRSLPRRRRLRRIRLAVAAVVTVALVVAAVAAVDSWQSRRRAEQQAVVARQLGEEVSSIETLLRFGHLSPPHDVSRERGQAEERLEALEDRFSGEGLWAQGPLAYARGRVALALEDPAEARRHLERAWERGYQRPEVALSLGLAFGGLYQQAAEAAMDISSPTLREEALLKAVRELQTPAAEWLRRGSGASSRELAEARIALYENRLEEAISQAASAVASVPWLYEAHEVEAQARLEEARLARKTGDRKVRQEALEAADEALRAGIAIARSHPEMHRRLCSLGGERLSIRRSLEDLGGFRRHSLPACEMAARLLPTSAQAPLALAGLEYGGAWLLVENRRDPGPWVDRMEEAARRALQLDPESAGAHVYLGRAAELRGSWQSLRGEGGQEFLARSLEHYGRATDLDPSSADAWYGFGLGRFNLAFDALLAGEDPVEELQKAVLAFNKARQLSPRAMGPVSMIGSSYGVMAMAALERGRDPATFLERSIASFEAASEMEPAAIAPRANRVMAYRDLAQHRWLTGEPLGDLVEQGRQTLEEVLRLSPEEAAVRFSSAELEVIAGRAALERGDSPKPFLEKAREQLAALRKTTGSPWEAQGPAVGILLIEADQRLAEGKDPRSLLEEAVEEISQGRSGEGGTAAAEELLGAVALRRARWTHGQGGDPAPWVEEGLEHVRRGLAEKPEDADLWLLQGRLQAAAGRSAEASLARAVELNPWLRRQVEALRGTAPSRARDPSPPVTE